jgi:hypothetical protein
MVAAQRGRGAHRVPGSVCQEEHKAPRRVVVDRRIDELRVARGAEIVDSESETSRGEGLRERE